MLSEVSVGVIRCHPTYLRLCYFRLHVLANTEDNSDTGDIELIRHLHVNVSSLKILLQGTLIVIVTEKLCNEAKYNLGKVKSAAAWDIGRT